jgi:hypothetical protein
MSRRSSGVLGVFEHLDTASDAIRRLRGEGYPLTVYSPTPRHELEEAIQPPESAVRIFTLMGAFTGSGAGAALAVWASLDWPLIVGGKEALYHPSFTAGRFGVFAHVGSDRFDAVRTIMTESGSEEVLLDHT